MKNGAFQRRLYGIQVNVYENHMQTTEENKRANRKRDREIKVIRVIGKRRRIREGMS